PDDLARSNVVFTSDPAELSSADFFIVTVPTPIDKARRPDLTALLRASATVGKGLKKGDIVVYESTVYPGATEEDCVPVLEQVSGLLAGSDFTVRYSPERINPGDKAHRFETITKVVAGQDARTLETIAAVYGSVIAAGLHKAPSIKVAEAAKVIENAQRDLHIAFMNELSSIFHELGGSIRAMCLQRPGRSGIFSTSPRAWSVATASGSIPITSRIERKKRLSPRRDSCRSAHQRFHRGARSARVPAPPLESQRTGAARHGAGTDIQGKRRGPAKFASFRHRS